MKIFLEEVGKKYRKQWVLRGLNAQLEQPQSWVILGRNGSGKSTLLRILAGIQKPSSGIIRTSISGKPLAQEGLFRHLSYCAPGVELIEELTLQEALAFHFRFKPLDARLRLRDLPEMLGLEKARDKPLEAFSSGMKQRVKLACTLFADLPLVLLDEPCTNLDDAGVQQYRDWVGSFRKEKLLIVASNDPREYDFCTEKLELGL